MIHIIIYSALAFLIIMFFRENIERKLVYIIANSIDIRLNIC